MLGSLYEMSLEQNRSGLNTKSVQEVSKRRAPKPPRLSKSDVRYWQQAISQPSYTWKGTRRNVGHWAVKVQHGGRRETIPLGTPNKTAAAQKAKEFYFCLQSSGWDQALLTWCVPSRGRSRSSSTAATVFRPTGFRAIRAYKADTCLQGKRQVQTRCAARQRRWRDGLSPRGALGTPCSGSLAKCDVNVRLMSLTTYIRTKHFRKELSYGHKFHRHAGGAC